MGKGMPQEIKERAVEMYLDGKTSIEVARNFNVNHTSVLDWVRQMGFEARTRHSNPACGSKTASAAKAPAPKGEINPLLKNLAGDNDLTPYVGKEITKMTPREIFAFLELLGVEGDLVIKQKVKLKKHSSSLPWAQ